MRRDATVDGMSVCMYIGIVVVVEEEVRWKACREEHSLLLRAGIVDSYPRLPGQRRLTGPSARCLFCTDVDINRIQS